MDISKENDSLALEKSDIETPCAKCGQLFRKGYLEVQRDVCIRCWSKGRRFRYQEEFTDIYIYGSYKETIRFLLSISRNKVWLDNFNGFLDESRFTEDEKKVIIKRLYYNLRGKNIIKDRIAYNKKKEGDRWSKSTYRDECPFCHKFLEFNRLTITLKDCPYCKRLICRYVHLTDKEIEDLQSKRQEHQNFQNKLNLNNRNK